MLKLRNVLTSATLCLVALFAASPALHAQLSTRSTITGTVTDSTGAVIPDATVTFTDNATKVAIVTHTNGSGTYISPGLTVSMYSLAVTKPGFKTATITNIELHPTETVQENVSLAVGNATENVEVGATSTDVELSTPENSAYISGEQVASLPMNGRNYTSVAGLLPGVINTSQGNALTTGGRSTNSSLSINGMAVSRSFYAVDGIWNENTGNMSQQTVIPNPDSLEEVRVLQDNFSAQYSLLGSSVVLLQTKSGTSGFHGTAWEFLRNDALNAKNYFTLSPPFIPPYKQNIFGFNVGGPVFIPHIYNRNRQKTFFFWDESYVVLHVPSQNVSQIPTRNQIAGCFVTPIKDPTTGQLFPTVSNCNGQAGTFYQIPGGRINSSSTAYLNALYPAPNYSNAANANNYINLQTVKTYQRDDQYKIDHYFTQNYHLLAEYFKEYQNFAQNTESPGTTPLSSETDFTNNRLAQVSLTQTFTPNMINTTNISMNIFLLNLTLVGKTDISQIPGFSENFFYPNALYASRTPVVNLTGLAGQGIQAARPIPHASDLDNTVSDNWSWLKGKHFITAGVSFVFNTKRQVSGQATNGNLTFTGGSTQQTAAQKTATGTCNTGNAIAPAQCTPDDSVADLLLGYVNSFSQVSAAPHGAIHAFSYSPYVEDRFQMNKNLTVTLGLRVYHMPLPYGAPNSETDFVASAFNPAVAPTVDEVTGNTNIAPGSTYSNGLLFNSGQAGGLPVNFSNNHIWYFAPDAGFAWDLSGDGKTSLRAGFGESYTRIFTNQDCSFGCIANPPAFTSQNFSNLVFPSTTTWDITKAGGTAKAVGVQSVSATDPNIQASPALSYSAGIQHEFPGNLVVSIIGAGTRLQHLVGTWNQNQPPPVTIGGVNYDFNPLINTNPANKGAGDSVAFYAPYAGYNGIPTIYTRLWQEWNGAEIQVKYPVTHSLHVTASYTYSHDTTNLAGSGVIDPYHTNRYHGNAESLNYPHSFSVTAIYQLPGFQNGNWMEKATLGGWTLDGIATFRSGTSLSPGLTEPNQGLAARPDQVPGRYTDGPKTWKVGTSQQWFNTTAFVNPAPGFYGNAQTGIIRGPGQEILNMSLFKRFVITEKTFFEFRAEAFNALNHTNPNNPNTTLGNGNYGKVTGAFDPRILELALRFKF